MSMRRADIRAQGLEKRAALREGAREHAAYQAAQERPPGWLTTQGQVFVSTVATTLTQEEAEHILARRGQ